MMMMNMMPMYFGCPVNNIYLFKSFTSNSGWTFTLWLIGIFLLAIGTHFLAYLRTEVQNRAIKDELREKLAYQTNL